MKKKMWAVVGCMNGWREWEAGEQKENCRLMD